LKTLYGDSHKGIHFIQNLMLNSNLKSDIQKSILKKSKRKKTVKPVRPSANTFKKE
jgi:hypothetical protein